MKRVTITVLLIFLALVTTNAQAIVDIKVQELQGSDRTDEYITFGHVFVQGEIAAGKSIIAESTNGTALPLQINKKSTHADGSLRHAILSLSLASISAGEIKTIKLKEGQSSLSGDDLKLSDVMASGLSASVSFNLNGKDYIASLSDGIANGSIKNWLEGSMASEWLVRADVKDNQGAVHPHLVVRFNVRAYDGFSRTKVDVIVENNWSYVPAPQNFNYDVTVKLGNQSVYTKTGLEHYHHARWKKTFWHNGDPGLDVIFDTNYLMQTRALPNYDLTLEISESTLNKVENDFSTSDTEPMGIAVLNAYMPATGGRPDIGPLTKWNALYILSMDKRVKDATMILGDSGGSWQIHYRDKNTDNPISSQDYPYAAIRTGGTGDTLNRETGINEAFPGCGGDCSTPYSEDVAHQPSFSYLPYLVSGDHYYLEELMFWASYNSIDVIGYYRDFASGLFKSTQIRAQGWSLRTLGQLAYIMPDSHALKGHYNNMVNKNLDWYNDNYTNNNEANKLGTLANGYAFPYSGGTGTAAWMNDFFTWSIGYLKALGFQKAAPLLGWVATSPIERMTNPGYCWIIGAPYAMTVRDTKDSPLYENFSQVYAGTASAAIIDLPCASQAMADVLNLKKGEMTGYSHSTTGFPSNMQPALAVVTETSNSKASLAWQTFDNRSVKPNYAEAPQFAIVPFISQGTLPVIDPPSKVQGLSISVQ